MLPVTYGGATDAVNVTLCPTPGLLGEAVSVVVVELSGGPFTVWETVFDVLTASN
jgi:hypothetical protein